MTHRANSTVQENRRNNKTVTAEINIKEKNETSSSNISNIVENENKYVKTINSSNREKYIGGKELDRNVERNKPLTQSRTAKRRRRRDVSGETTGSLEDGHVVVARQAKSEDTVYDWSVDELSESEKWQVDRIDPDKKVRI